MDSALQAVERSGTLEAPDLVRLDSPLPISAPHSLRVILLYAESVDAIKDEEWLAAALKNEAFDFLNDPLEDIYSISDGKPWDAR